MPVTAKLSREFYDKFGDKIADELVNWFNQVDATYRSDLRELNELNFHRFDAKLEQRIAETRAELRQEMTNLRADLRGLEGRLQTSLHEMKSDLLKSTYGAIFFAWATLLGAMIALIKLE